MRPFPLRLLLATPLLMAALAYPTAEDIPDPFSDPLTDGPSLYRAWRASRDHSAPASAAWTLEEEQVLVQIGMKRRVEAFANWLNPWGEGQITVFDNATGNLTMPHRPAAFPAHLPAGAGFPLMGTLEMITDFPGLPGSVNASTDIYGCSPVVPVSHPISAAAAAAAAGIRNDSRIALVVRGHCSFSQKVRAAQARGADVVLVADDTASAEETDEQGRTRFGLLTMYSPDDTTDIHIPSSFISRASFLVIRDLMDTGRSQIKVLIEPDDGYDWPLSDLLVFVMLLPSVITIITILLNKYQSYRQVRPLLPQTQRQRDRAPREAVLSLPEAIWIPEQWEKEDDSPTRARDGEADQPGLTDSQTQGTSSAADRGDGAVEDRARSPVQDASRPKPKPHPKRKYYSKDECSICLGSFERGDVIRILPCGHLFHKTEVDDWLVKWKKVCPVCRMDITAAPTTDTLALPAETATTPLVALDRPLGPDSQTGSDPEAPPAPALGGLWAWVRRLRRGTRVTSGEERGEETPLLR